MTEKELELYGMVQEGKRLLLMWKATSKLSKEQKRNLQSDTKKHLLKSSTLIITGE